jgi:hypothetical protein
MKKLFLLLPVSLLFLPCVFGIEDRTFEIGFNAGFSFSNDFLSRSDFFNEKKTIELDLNKLEDGFMMNMGIGASPFFFNYKNKKGGWGFGLSTRIDAMGIMNLSGKMLTFYETKNEDDGISEISGAVFAEAAVPVHLTYNKFRFKIKPSLFWPIVYATSDISYIYDNSDINRGTILNLNYDVMAYTPVSNAGSGLTSSPGVDFYLGVDYPISEVLGLNKIPLLDFDVGLELFGIPLFAGVMESYTRTKGSVGSENPIKLFDDDFDMEHFLNIAGDAVEGDNGNKKIFRPFKLLLHADWRPLDIKILKLIVTPSLGFAVSSIYNKPFSMEGGLKAAIDFSNIFIFSLGTGYHDRLWKNGLDLTLNLRAVEFNLGLALCSPRFTKSWNGSGFAFDFGLKFGW